MPEILIIPPIIKAMKAFCECFLIENPVCMPITEINKEEPSFVNIFIVFFVFITASKYVSDPVRLINNPMIIATNNTPAMPTDIFLIFIFPNKNPKEMIINKRFIGEFIVVKKVIIIN